MIARVCATQVARQIVRALHLAHVEGQAAVPVPAPSSKRKSTSKVRKKKKAAA